MDDLKKLTPRKIAEMIVRKQICEREVEKAFEDDSAKLDLIFDIVSEYERGGVMHCLVLKSTRFRKSCSIKE